MAIKNISEYQPRNPKKVKAVDRKKSGNMIPDLTLSIGVIYIALFSLVFLLAPAKFANAASSDNNIRYILSVDINLLRPVSK